MLSDPTVLILMYFVLPLWLVAGFADWLCHRASHIETTTGAKESLIHLLMFTEVGIPLLAAMFLDINALIIAGMLVAWKWLPIAVLLMLLISWARWYELVARVGNIEVVPVRYEPLKLIPLREPLAHLIFQRGVGR